MITGDEIRAAAAIFNREHPSDGVLFSAITLHEPDKAALGQAPRLKDIARWHRKQGTVTHVFTHFPLELVVYTASIPTRARAPTGMRWVSIATLTDEALPNVMRKVIAHGLGD